MGALSLSDIDTMDNKIDRKLNYKEIINDIVGWIKKYSEANKIDSLVIGVSGGIDSAVVSTLCAKTGMPVYALSMPIHQKFEQEDLSNNHLSWLTDNYSNVHKSIVDLSAPFEAFKNSLPFGFSDNNLALANSRSRLRMLTLYQAAGVKNGIVVGTGNKVEDYGIGFYTKYGDGGVDIAPIADLYKSEVYTLGKHLNVIEGILNAKPTDGLWDDGRTDEDQIGCTYDELEYAMEFGSGSGLEILNNFNKKNQHKMNAIPTFKLKYK
jgi:NAD+ synthase